MLSSHITENRYVPWEGTANSDRENGVETGVLNEGVSLECELSIVTAKKNKKNVMNLYWCFELLICFVFL